MKDALLFSSEPLCGAAPPSPPPAPLCCLFLLFPSCSASRPSEPSDELAELALLRFTPLAMDWAMAHHLHHCPYHLHLRKAQLMCGQELPESLHGQPL